MIFQQLNLANTSIELSKQNIHRFIRILFPPKAEILSNMCQQGFDDALHFLHRNNLISCTRCLAIQSTFILSKQTPEHYDPECSSCTYHRDESLENKSMPETVLTVMEKYLMKNSSSGFFRWIQQPALFILRTVSVPATMPFDFVAATVGR
jgi:patatin-like phospholipase domain-containing protein 2